MLPPNAGFLKLPGNPTSNETLPLRNPAQTNHETKGRQKTLAAAHKLPPGVAHSASLVREEFKRTCHSLRL